MVGTRPDNSSHAPFSSSSPRRGGRLVGGQKRTWVRPLGLCSLMHACAEGQDGARGRSDTRCHSADSLPPAPTPVSMSARRKPRSPAPGPRLTVRAQHPGKVGSGARGCARSHPSGEGKLWRLRHLVSLSLPASSGACSPPPLPPRRGEGPLLVAAFTALNSPKGRHKSHASAPTASSHATEMRSVS